MQFTNLAMVVPAGLAGGAALNIGWYAVAVARTMFTRMFKRFSFTGQNANRRASEARWMSQNYDEYGEMLDAAADAYRQSQAELPPQDILFIVPNELEADLLAREMGIPGDLIALPTSEAAVSQRRVKRIMVLRAEDCLAVWARSYDRGGDLLAMLEQRVAGVPGGMVELCSSPDMWGNA